MTIPSDKEWQSIMLFGSGTPRYIPIIWAIIFAAGGLILELPDFLPLQLAGYVLFSFSAYAVYAATLGHAKSNAYNVGRFYEALKTAANEHIIKELIDRFLLPDQIDFKKFSEAWENYEHFRHSPFIPRWFSAAYPDVVRFVGSLKLETEEELDRFLGEAYISKEEFEQVDDEGFNMDVLHKPKEYYKRRFPGRRLENAV